ncbi:NADH dehydrogenase I chain G, partial [mine drainage metagenome]
VTAREGETILQVLRREKVETPTLCFHDNLTPAKACRACVVELKNSRALVASCERKAEAGMEIQTESERVQNARRGVFELLLSQNNTDTAPSLLAQAKSLGADPDHYKGQRYEHGFHDDNQLYVRDYDKCILCYRCVEACGVDAQNTFALTVAGR